MLGGSEGSRAEYREQRVAWDQNAWRRATPFEHTKSLDHLLHSGERARVRGARLDPHRAICDVWIMQRTTHRDGGKEHWYDGAFFDLCIAPNQDAVFAAIRAGIPPGSTVLDVGCGTGRLVFQLADHCGMVQGIDPSHRNIRRAQVLHRRRGHRANISFESASLEHYLTQARETFDVGVVSYVLHEVDEGARAPMVRLLAGSVRTVILADYRVPRRRGLMDAATEVVEFLAGREHYRGFRSFVRRDGLPGLVRETGLLLHGELACSQPTAQVFHVAGLGG